jgi:hypothetical protein
VISIPGWSVDNDEIICIPELKLGLIGMSCVVPGFATMVSIKISLNIHSEAMCCFSYR